MVKPKKHLGQHFLRDSFIAEKIANTLQVQGKYDQVLEIGAGTGVLTQHLESRPEFHLYPLDIDRESIDYLKKHFPELKERILEGDFLQMHLAKFFPDDKAFGIIGNFPYNISTQIFFRVLEYRDRVPEVVGMLQKEVAQRIAAPPGSKTYGILSVLLQAYYDIELCFEVGPEVFDPPPKVHSAVIHLQRNQVKALDCDEKLFFRVVKMAFQQRRKMLRNALKSILPEDSNLSILSRRAETLSVEDFVGICQWIQASV